MRVQGLEAFNRDRALLFSLRFYRIYTIMGKNDRGLANADLEGSETNTLVMKGEDSVTGNRI